MTELPADPFPDVQDADTWPDERLGELREAVVAEINRRAVLASAEYQAAVLADSYLDARDGAAPDPVDATVDDYPPYVPVTGAHNVYTPGRVVNVDGQLWRAVMSASHSPVDAPEQWQRVWLVNGALSEDPDPGTGTSWPEWDPDTSYRKVGDETIMVIHNGRLWELIHTNADPGWEPGTLPSVWADHGEVEAS